MFIKKIFGFCCIVCMRTKIDGPVMDTGWTKDVLGRDPGRTQDRPWRDPGSTRVGHGMDITHLYLTILERFDTLSLELQAYFL